MLNPRVEQSAHKLVVAVISEVHGLAVSETVFPNRLLHPLHSSIDQALLIEGLSLTLSGAENSELKRGWRTHDAIRHWDQTRAKTTPFRCATTRSSAGPSVDFFLHNWNESASRAVPCCRSQSVILWSRLRSFTVLLCHNENVLPNTVWTTCRSAIRSRALSRHVFCQLSCSDPHQTLTSNTCATLRPSRRCTTALSRSRMSSSHRFVLRLTSLVRHETQAP